MKRYVIAALTFSMIYQQISAQRYNVTFPDDDSLNEQSLDRNRKNRYENSRQRSKRTNSLMTNGHGANIVFRLINENNHQYLNEVMMRYPFRKSAISSSGYHILCSAIFNKNINMLKSLSKNFSMSLALDAQKNNTVHLCAMMEWEEGLEFAINKERSSSAMYAKNLQGNTPFDIARASGNKKIIAMLSKYQKGHGNKKISGKYERVNLQDYDSDNANNLLVLKAAGYDELFWYALNKDANGIFDKISEHPNVLTTQIDKYNNNVLHILCLFGAHEVLGRILSEMSNSNVTKAVNARNFMGNTPLHIAASMNDDNSVQSIMEYQYVDLSILNNAYMSPLMIPVRNYGVYQWEKDNTRKIIYDMIRYESDKRFNDHFYARDNFGNTIFHLAAMQGIVKMLMSLILHGYDVNTRNNNGETGADKLGNGVYRAENNDKLYAMYNFMKHLEETYQRGNTSIGKKARQFLEDHGIQMEKYIHDDERSSQSRY